jgi:hypothetical protein
MKRMRQLTIANGVDGSCGCPNLNNLSFYSRSSFSKNNIKKINRRKRCLYIFILFTSLKCRLSAFAAGDACVAKFRLENTEETVGTEKRRVNARRLEGLFDRVGNKKLEGNDKAGRRRSRPRCIRREREKKTPVLLSSQTWRASSQRRSFALR